jgi:ATP-dependent RNA helicase DeaD
MMPDQLRSFSEFNLHETTARALADMGFEEPTDVQSAAFTPIVEGKELIVQARTGTGKTAAFLIPLVDRLLTSQPKVQMLALCPTRELALQVAGEFAAVSQHKGYRVATLYGGAAIGKQISQLEEGVHAVVGTPGRVLDHIRRGTLSLKDVKHLVLDEADEMLSMGFEKEISAIIEKVPKQRQTLLFSATIASDIQRLSQRYMESPTILSLSDDYVGAKEVEHAFYMVSGTGRLADLVRIIDVEDPDSALIFCNTRDDVNLVAAGLKRHGFTVEYISSDLSQSEREAAMGRMREGNVRFLVATDVAARGIDISHVTHVINYTFPESLEVYIHRTGRTGRMGRTGWAISLITPRDVGNLYFLKLTYRITPIERQLPTEGELAAREESDLLTQLLQEHTEPFDEAALSLARRVTQHVRGTEVVAALIHRVLNEGAAVQAGTNRRRREGSPLEPLPEAKEETEETRTKPRRTRQDKTKTKAQEEGEKKTATRERKTRTRNTSKAKADQLPTEQPQVEESTAPVATPALPPDGDNLAAEMPGVTNGAARVTIPISANAMAAAREAEALLEAQQEQVTKEIYVSLGRRDGVRSAEIVKLLTEGGIDREMVGRIRVRDRSTFVEVRPDIADAALEALNGAKFGSRVASAEHAKRLRA